MRILLADRQVMVREALVGMFSAAGLPPVTQCDALADVNAALVTAPPDLAILDSTVVGIDDVASLASAFPGVPIALMVSSASREQIDIAFRAGAIGVIPKSIPAVTAISAIRRMLQGSTFDPGDAELPQRANAYALTRRELDVLRGLFAGKSNKEIGRDLELQEVTVKLHVKTLSRKLAAKNRTHAAMIARNEGLV
jgi:two-component system, NarL family, nitrate/nitrite response regulator NarL